MSRRGVPPFDEFDDDEHAPVPVLTDWTVDMVERRSALVLGALRQDSWRTVAETAWESGLSRAVVRSTLSRLFVAGDVQRQIEGVEHRWRLT